MHVDPPLKSLVHCWNRAEAVAALRYGIPKLFKLMMEPTERSMPAVRIISVMGIAMMASSHM